MMSIADFMFNFKKDNLARLKTTARTSWRMLGFVWETDKLLFASSVVAIIIPAIVPFINIYIYKLVIDRVVQVVSGAPLDPTYFYLLLALRVFTYFVQDVAFRTQRLVERLLWTKVPIRMNQVVSAKIASLDVQHYEDSDFQTLLEKVNDSVGFRPQRLVGNLLFGLQSFVSLAIAFITLVYLNWLFVIFIIIAALPELLLQTYYSKLTYGIWDEEGPVRKKYFYLNGLLRRPRVIAEIKLFNLAGKFLKEVLSLQVEYYNKNKKLTLQAYRSGIGSDGLSTVIFVGIEIYVIFQALLRKVTVGDISFYTGVVGNFQNSLNGLLRNFSEVYDSGLYVQSIFELLETEPFIKDAPAAISIPLAQAPLIEFKNVDFSYPGSKKKILKDFSLTIQPGEKIALVGENGAGKSTIIKLLTRFYDVTAGEILINGTNIKDIKRESWYKQIGVLFQDFNRYDHTAKENIHFGDIDKPQDDELIQKAAIQSGAHSMISGFEKGYDQMLGKMFTEGMELSGGQWQKIALSRAFFRNAPVLVLDEPTSAIDAKAEAEIFDRVERLSKDKTVIIISHRFSTVRNADKIFVIKNGNIVESGSHQQLMHQDGLYATLFKLQAKGYQ